jgi:hypothetical protein
MSQGTGTNLKLNEWLSYNGAYGVLRLMSYQVADYERIDTAVQPLARVSLFSAWLSFSAYFATNRTFYCNFRQFSLMQVTQMFLLHPIRVRPRTFKACIWPTQTSSRSSTIS